MIYEGIRDGAIKPLIAQYGYLMTLKCDSPKESDENTGLVTSGIEQSWPVVGLEADFELKDIDGSNVKLGDKLIILAAEDGLPTPNSDYKLVIGIDTWNIVRCSPIQPGGVVLTFELHVRR